LSTDYGLSPNKEKPPRQPSCRRRFGLIRAVLTASGRYARAPGHPPQSAERDAVGKSGKKISKEDAEEIKTGYLYTPRTASEYAKLRYTPWTYFPAQNSRPYDTWVKYFRGF